MSSQAYPQIAIKNFGPIKEFGFSLKNFNIFTGPQASGKSTVAKAVFFCRTIKNEIVDQIRLPKREDVYPVSLEKGIEKRLRKKFLQMFGSTWAMPMSMEIVYYYAEDKYVRVFLEESKGGDNKNFVKFEFSDCIMEYISGLSEKDYTDSAMLDDLRQEINGLFEDEYECIYIPAGRAMITLLTDQISYIFSSSTPEISTTIDYCTRNYVEQIMKFRPLFKEGMQGLFSDKLKYTQDKINKPEAGMMMEFARKVLKGDYRYVGAEERLMLDDGKYVKINYASSGQQESSWIFNFLFYYMLNKRRVFMIIEEPEAHLYPEAQYNMSKALSLFANSESEVLVTTHSPYLLGAFNNLLYSSQLSEEAIQNQNVIDRSVVLEADDTIAYHMNNGDTRNAMDEGLILNELIDGAASMINEECDRIMELIWEDN